MAKRYRKLPVVIEAKVCLGTPESNREIIEWTKGSKTPALMDTVVRNCSPAHPDGFDYPALKISTLEGLHLVSPGDYVIKGVAGEFYPCKPDIFAATYEIADKASLTADARIAELEALLNTPSTAEFFDAVRLEAAHQKLRWPEGHDEAKTPEDWLWLISHLVTKATQAQRYGDDGKYSHHIITAAAALSHWHEHALCARG